MMSSYSPLVSFSPGGLYLIDHLHRLRVGNLPSLVCSLSLPGESSWRLPRSVLAPSTDCSASLSVRCGGAKVPGKVYKAADWNVSVTTQPHSEVSSLAVFQHLLMDGKEFELEFENPVLEVIPTAHGKTVNIHNENR